MQSLLEYLASAPKPHLARLYRRDHPDSGLLQSAQVVEAVRARALDPGRLHRALEELDREGRRLLLAIYVSEQRGLVESELARTCEGGGPAAAYYLAALEHALLIFPRDGEARSYHGFKELVPLVLPLLLAEFVPPEPAVSSHWISNSAHVASHFCHFLAKAARGELRLTQAGEMHRKSLQEISRAFGAGASLSAAAAEEEALLFFRFGAEEGLLAEEEGVLRPATEAEACLDEGHAELLEKMREWWLRRRAGGWMRTLKALSAAGEKAYPVIPLSQLFTLAAAAERNGRQAAVSTWENLPRALRELWIWGGAEFALEKGRIRWARLKPEAPGEPAASEPPRGLPNFEALVPMSSPLHRLYQVEILARRDNDELWTRYRFSKESVVQGLQAGLKVEALGEAAAWLGFDTAARRALAEWASTYSAAVFREVFVLRVFDAARFRELQEFPEFMALVAETIPGYGFVLPRASREPARALLRAFDLLPGEEIPAGRETRPAPVPARESDWLPPFTLGEIEYRPAPAVRRPPAADRERSNKPRPEETPEQRLQALEQAIQSGKHVEFAYNSHSVRLRVQPLHVLRNREPMKLIGVESGTGHRNEYLLDKVSALRLVDGD